MNFLKLLETSLLFSVLADLYLLTRITFCCSITY